ncbi:MAG TPA: hypothetical protein VGE02_05590 [Gemmatimonadales bacterium]
MSRFLTLIPLVAAGCVTTSTVAYRPSAEQPRMSLAEGQVTLRTFLGMECARLREAGIAGATVPVTVALDAEGNVTEAELERSTGDSRADGVVGAVAAQLRLEPTASGRAMLRGGYRCGDDGGVDVTLERAT